MSPPEEQHLLDIITLETKKKKSLESTCAMEEEQRAKLASANKSVEKNVSKNESAEEYEHKIDLQNETEERRFLIQNIINEASAAGTKISPSLIKLLNHLSGNIFFPFIK